MHPSVIGGPGIDVENDKSISSVNGNTTEEGKWMVIGFLVESKECLENVSW